MSSQDVQPEFQQLIDTFIESLIVERNASAHTVRNYRIDLSDYARWAARAGIDPLHPTHRQLRRYLAELDKARYARSTVNRRLSALRSFLSWATVAGYASDNPADVLMSGKKDKTLPHRIPQKEVRAILGANAACVREENDPVKRAPYLRNQALLEFLYASGARISEASSLLTSNFDAAQGQVRLSGKGSKERIVPVHQLAVETMMRYYHEARPLLLKGAEDPGYFFLSTRGKQFGPDVMRRMFHQTLKRAGVSSQYTPHDLRHTFASDVLDGGADLRSVQEMLGHASLSTTQIYTHLTGERLKAVHAQAHPRA